MAALLLLLLLLLCCVGSYRRSCLRGLAGMWAGGCPRAPCLTRPHCCGRKRSPLSLGERAPRGNGGFRGKAPTASDLEAHAAKKQAWQKGTAEQHFHNPLADKKPRRPGGKRGDRQVDNPLAAGTGAKDSQGAAAGEEADTSGKKGALNEGEASPAAAVVAAAAAAAAAAAVKKAGDPDASPPLPSAVDSSDDAEGEKPAAAAGAEPPLDGTRTPEGEVEEGEDVVVVVGEGEGETKANDDDDEEEEEEEGEVEGEDGAARIKRLMRSLQKRTKGKEYKLPVLGQERDEAVRYIGHTRIVKSAEGEALFKKEKLQRINAGLPQGFEARYSQSKGGVYYVELLTGKTFCTLPAARKESKGK